MNNSELCHKFAHLEPEDRYTRSRKGSNLYYSGGVMYSYGDHFPIAAWVRHPESGTDYIAMFDGDPYSSTTSRHMRIMRNALPPLVGFKVVLTGTRLPYNSGMGGLGYWREKYTQEVGGVRQLILNDPHVTGYEYVITNAVKKASRARVSTAFWVDIAQRLYEDYQRYCSIMHIDLTLAKDELDKDLEKNTGYTIDSFQALTDSLLVKKQEQENDLVNKFQETGVPFSSLLGYSYLYLDTKKDVVKTSQGMTLLGSIRHWRTFAKQLQAGSTYVVLTKVEHDIEYEWKLVVSNEFATAGCHKIPMTHIRKVFNIQEGQ